MQAENAGFINVQREFTRYIRAPHRESVPQGMEARRMKIYAELFYNNVQNLFASTFPVLRQILGDNAWHALIRDYFEHHQAHTPLFPQMPKEFLAYLQEERGEQPQDPLFIGELAHYEWVELALSIDPREIPGQSSAPTDETLLSTRPQLSPLAWLLAYRFAVHKLSVTYCPQDIPEHPTYLVVYRNRGDEVGFLVLNPVSARLLELISTDNALNGEEMLAKISDELQHPNFEVVKHGGLQILRELVQRDILV